MCPWKLASRGCVLYFWQLEDLSNHLLTLPSPHTFQFPEHPKTCPVCKWKPSLLPEAGGPWLLSTGKETTSPGSSWCQV